MAKKKRQVRGKVNTSTQYATDIPGDFNPDYSYVIKDLKRIGLLAGLFFAVLVSIAIIMPLLVK